ncbi:hypothetical protein [Actinacidiphila oryziradicis]|uniref:hypothetical protein n=1 Tax=Actinacidiphila oryziradicis TaxID=2571141 RepID=UPI00145D2C96|nr:hypothetical protein [Actinacidiphila oryziradicis]
MEWVNPKYVRLAEYARKLQAVAPRGRGPKRLGAATVIDADGAPYTVTYGQPGDGPTR